jgi:uncharacterized protein (TIGR00730 family)
MRRVAVFCGSKSGFSPAFEDLAQRLGAYLAINKIGLVYGGANTGLMGTLASSILSHGGEAIGVMPVPLEKKDFIHTGLTKLVEVKDLQERKAQMATLSDGFIAMPGGTGTLDEIFEMITLSQMGQHRKPCAFLDVDGFYASLITFLADVRDKGFLHPDYFDMLLHSSDIEELISQMNGFKHPHT